MTESSDGSPEPIGPLPPTRPPSVERAVRILTRLGLFALLLVGLAAYWLFTQLQGSLAVLEGEVPLPGLSQPVTIERDAQGAPTIRALDRLDLSMALGFLHAQERFFQMDLMRRRGAGELSALLGEAALRADRNFRLHRFRARAQAALAELGEEQKENLAAYADGINQGLASLSSPPFEYLVLGAQPQPWKIEDSLLVIYSMYFELNDSRGRHESARGLIHDVLGPEMLAFLTPWGTDLDAPIEGEVFPSPPPPPPGVYSLRPQIVGEETSASDPLVPDPTPLNPDSTSGAGSNNWVVAGQHTAHGSPILANDMHLPLRVPNIWYRASLVYPDPNAPGSDRRITGVTLPGAAPVVVVGSNGHVAWGFTNSYGDWVDLVVLDELESMADTYSTPDGPRTIERRVEILEVKGGEPEELEVLETIWGPIVDEDHQGKKRAVRWIAHDPRAVSSNYLALESARSVQEAVAVAQEIGSPPQNFVTADEHGGIAWTILGPIPRRFGHDGRLPTSWADGSRGWDGYLSPGEVPAVVNPDEGRIWTGNSRVPSAEKLAVIGLGDYELGARARQIRDHLRQIRTVTEVDLLAVQLDDRAIFLTRWRDLLIKALTEEAISEDPRREKLRQLATEWGGHAAADSAGYRLVRAFRTIFSEQVFDTLTNPCKEADEDFDYSIFQQREGPLWHLITYRPEHLLAPEFDSWDAQILAAADAVLDHFELQEGGLADRTWGERNTAAIRHPLSQFIPGSARWLDMPAAELAGDSNMPRVQGPGFGASERIIVSPGREDEGIFHMPTGQSGHPMSPFYESGHADWVEGRASSFLPGQPAYVLSLVPPTSP